MQKTAIHAELPRDLVLRAQTYIAQGWASDLDWLLAEALRRYLTTHSSELAESFLREDVAWGLNGQD